MTETTTNIEILPINAKLEDIFTDENGVKQDIVDRINTIAPQRLVYPCILVKFTKPNFSFADNTKYTYRKKYELHVIDTKPDSPYVEAILKGVPLSSYITSYVSDRLFHTILELFL